MSFQTSGFQSWSSIVFSVLLVGDAEGQGVFDAGVGVQVFVFDPEFGLLADFGGRPRCFRRVEDAAVLATLVVAELRLCYECDSCA